MSLSLEFIKDVFRILHARLAQLGFDKRKPGIMTIKKSKDVYGWIGLNTATRGNKGYLEINPVVGIRNQKIERLVADLLGERFNEVVPPTLAGNVGYMMPSNKYCPYVFSKDSPAEIVAEQLVYDVRNYGMAFMTDHLDLGALVEGMRTSRFAVRFMVAYRIPAGLFLLGRMDDAQKFLKVELDETGDRHDPAALRFRAFAAKLAELIDREAS